MKAYELAFPETASMNPNDVVGPLTATIATVQTQDGRSQNVNGNTEVDLASNPITNSVKSFVASQAKDILWVAIGLIILTIAVLRLSRG